MAKTNSRVYSHYSILFKNLLFSFLLISLPQLCIGQLNGSYTIDSTSQRTSRNFQSFQDLTLALDSHGVSAPIEVSVVPGSGPYNEQVVFGPYIGVSATNNITIKGNGETIQSASTLNSGKIISIDSSKHITLDSLRIVSGQNMRSIGVHFTRHADSNVVKNCIIDLSSVTTHPSFTTGLSAGIAICNQLNINSGPGRVNYLLIENNSFIGDTIGNGGPSAAIHFEGINNTANKIINNSFNNFHRTAIVANSQDGLLIIDNLIRRTKSTTNTPSGIFLGNDSKNCRIENNRITEFNKIGAGIFLNDNRFNFNDPNYIINNSIYNILSKEGVGISVISSHAVNVYHNTISFDDTTQSNFFFGGTTTGIVADGREVDVRNNNIRISNNGDGEKLGLNIGFGSSLMTYDNNNIYVFSNSNVDQYHAQFSASSRYKTLAEWKIANSTSGNAQNSTSLDPLFLDSEVPIPTNPLLDNKASTIGVTTDIDSNLRSMIPDVGAYEFDSSDYNSFNYPYYPISVINTEDPSGFPDSANVICKTSGTIVGVDLDTNFSFEYFLIGQSTNSQQGISMLGFDSIPNSMLIQGDSVEVTGTILQKGGNPYISAHSINFISSGRTIPDPIEVDSISEIHQGKLVEIKNSILSRRFFYSSGYDMFVQKNNASTRIFLPLASRSVLDTISFANSWLLGDSICSIKGVVVQTDFRFFPTRTQFTIYPRYSSDFDKDSCSILTTENEVSYQSKSYSLFPNPSRGVIDIYSANGFSKNTRVEVYNLSSQLLYRTSIDSKVQTSSIDLSHLSSGTYIIRLHSRDGITNMKLSLID